MAKPYCDIASRGPAMHCVHESGRFRKSACTTGRCTSSLTEFEELYGRALLLLEFRLRFG